ncbi:histidine phosphatase family protein [Bacillus sp. SD088]|uniref:histidine phosphatase family protein n=1 Tax=Bacillus sp. SD088 TaxID=2782012 RepID=UPI001A962FAF|nr:histidine phosphatase family protein [Bacillus sp. SD088]MBO0992885.1 histidine phosphatase family protein [Bacillus sp. SD088]
MVNEIIFLRHGIRLDVDDNKYCRHYLKRKKDIPLSHRGIIQAEETGEFLKKENVDYIFCSPFFRTLQTAQEVAEKLDKSFNIEHGFIEHLNQDWFPDYPETISKEEALSIFPNVNPNYESLVRPTYPEIDYEVDVLNRVKKTLDAIMENYDGTILVVGHWASAESGAKALMYPEPLDGFNFKMCALNKYVRSNDKWTFAYGSTEHLSEESLLN